MGRPLAMGQLDHQQISAVQASYLAGVFDADGSISIARSLPSDAGMLGTRVKNPRYVLRINIVNTSVELMNWLYENFGGLVKKRPLLDPVRHRQTFDWAYDNGKALRILELIEPYLIIKKERVELGLQLLRGWQSSLGRGAMTDPAEVARRESIYQRMKFLNQFGPSQGSAVPPSAASAARSFSSTISTAVKA